MSLDSHARSQRAHFEKRTQFKKTPNTSPFLRLEPKRDGDQDKMTGIAVDGRPWSRRPSLDYGDANRFEARFVRGSWAGGW